jgi:general secretion pathway protein M
MNDFLKSWWRTRTSREQKLLLAMVGLAAVVFTWLLIIRPLSDALSRARERHGDAVLAVAQARAQAQAISGFRRTAPEQPAMPLDSLLNQSASEAGFPVTRVEREGENQATITIQPVRPQAFFAWVDQMEARNGLIVERLTANTNSDQTLQVTVTFRARALSAKVDSGFAAGKRADI